MSDYKIPRNESLKHERQFWWVLNLTFSLPGWVTPGAMGAPHNTLAAVSLLLGPTPLALREPDRQIPLHAVKPSTREQRGQVLRATLRAHLHPAGEQTSPTNTSSNGQIPTPGGNRLLWICCHREISSSHREKQCSECGRLHVLFEQLYWMNFGCRVTQNRLQQVAANLCNYQHLTGILSSCFGCHTIRSAFQKFWRGNLWKRMLEIGCF